MENIKLGLFETTSKCIQKLLTDFEAVLNNPETSPDDLTKLEEESKKLIAKLNELVQIKSTTPYRVVARKSCGFFVSNDKMVIGYNLKYDIVQLLQQNSDIAIRYSDGVSEAIKKQLIGENEHMIDTLKGIERVESWTTFRLDKNPSSSSSEDEDDQSSNQSNIKELRRELQVTQEKMEKRINDKLAGFQTQLNGFQSELTGLQNQLPSELAVKKRARKS